MRSLARTVAAACALAAVITVVVLVFRYQTKAWIITGLAVLPVAWSVTAAIFLWWRRDQRAALAASTVSQVVAAAEWLAAETGARWKKEAADRRITTPAPARVRWHWAPESISVSAAEATVPPPPGTAPAPLPGTGLPAVILSTGLVTRLHDEVYARLPAGRLALTGGPGAGKTGAMVLLLLAALDWRARQPDGSRSQVPVPVWLTMGGWNPAAESLTDWVAESLSRDYPALRAADYGDDAATSLLRAGRIALFLDGFDELPPGLRAAAIRRLNTEAADLRVVLTSRPAEYEHALREVSLDNCAVIELRPIRPAEAAAYLLRGQAGPSRTRWLTVASYLEAAPESVVAHALDSPLTLSLAREAYAGRDPSVLTDPGRFPTTDAVTTHLVDQFLLSAYKDERERAHAIQWLAWIASNMGAGRELRWWDIPRWVAGGRLRLARAVTAGLLAAAVVTPLAWVTDRDFTRQATQPDTYAWAVPGIAAGIGVALLSGLFFKLAGGQPAARTRPAKRLKPVLKAAGVWGLALLLGGLLSTLLSALIALENKTLAANADGILWIVLTFLLVEAWRAKRGLPRPSQAIRRAFTPQTERRGRDLVLEKPVARSLSLALAAGIPVAAWTWWHVGPQDLVSNTVALVIYVLPLAWVLGLLWRGAAGGVLGSPWSLAPRWPRPAWLVPVGLLAFPLVIPRWVSSWVTPAADAPSATSMSTYRADRRSSVVYAGGYAAMLVLPLFFCIALILGASSAIRLERGVVALAWVAVTALCASFTAWLCSGQVPLVKLAQLALLPSHGSVSFDRLLDDAHRRQVLRQAGTVYQFRHAALQSRLAYWAAAGNGSPHSIEDLPATVDEVGGRPSQ